MRGILVLLLLVVLTTSLAQAGLLGKKKHKKHHSSTSTSTSTSTTTSTTSTERPETTESFLEDDDGADNVLYLDNMDIIKIHLPLPVRHNYDDSPEYTTSSVPNITPDTPPHPLPTATVPSHLPTAPSIIDGVTGAKDADKEDHTDEDEDGGYEPATTEIPEIPEVPEVPEEPEDEDDDVEVTTTAKPAADDADQVVIPDVATFDAVFANRTRLADDIRVFTFGGLYEIIVNRTRNSVEVVMVRHQTANKNESVQLREVTEVTPPVDRERLQMMVRGPAVTGLETTEEQEHADGGEDDDEHGEKRHHDEHGDQNDNSVSDHEYQNTKDDDEEHDKAGKDSRHSKDQAQDDFNAVFINGSALSGVDVGVVSFNTSGTFRLNVSVSEDFMTVIISQLSEQIQGNGVAVPDSLAGFDGPDAPLRMRSAAPTEQDGGSGSMMPIFTVLAVGAVATLFVAVVIWRARHRSRVNTFVRRDYLPM